jgi:hypothetical protein
MDKKTIEKIVEAAAKAPSGDNVQPWRFEVSNDFTQLNLYNLPEKDDSYFNYQQTASYIAHGAVIENMAIAAQHWGYKAQIELFPDSTNLNHVARVDFMPTTAESDPLYEAIVNRCTNRFPYERTELTEEDLTKFFDVVKQVDNVKAYFVHRSQAIKKLAKVIMVNDRLVFERQDIHRFLFDKVRWSKDQIESTKDGMPVDTLGLNPLEKLFFPLMRFWWFVNAANYLGLSRVIGLKCWNNCRNVSLLGQITVKEADKQGLVQAGRAMQRVWLEATRQGLAFQPIIGLPLLIYRLKQNALQSFSGKHRQIVEQAEKALTQLFEINQSETMIVGFRIGKGRPVLTKTQRKPVY